MNKTVRLMKKRLLNFSFLAMLLLAVPNAVNATNVDMEMGIVEQAGDEISLTINGQQITVYGAQGETLEVVTLTGRVMKRIKIDNNIQRIELNVQKGCYILKIGKLARKVSMQ